MRHRYALAAVLAAAACGSTSPTYPSMGPGVPPGGTGGAAVAISDYAFSPESITVKAGTTVTWTNDGPSGHTTTSDDGTWDSGTLASPTPGGAYGGGTAGGTYSVALQVAGTYRYHCAIHSTMHGVVVVTP